MTYLYFLPVNLKDCAYFIQYVHLLLEKAGALHSELQIHLLKTRNLFGILTVKWFFFPSGRYFFVQAYAQRRLLPPRPPPQASLALVWLPCGLKREERKLGRKGGRLEWSSACSAFVVRRILAEFFRVRRGLVFRQQHLFSKRRFWRFTHSSKTKRSASFSRSFKILGLCMVSLLPVQQ